MPLALPGMTGILRGFIRIIQSDKLLSQLKGNCMTSDRIVKVRIIFLSTVAVILLTIVYFDWLNSRKYRKKVLPPCNEIGKYAARNCSSDQFGGGPVTERERRIVEEGLQSIIANRVK